MKKLLGISLLAGLAVLATERPVQAWCNSKFSIGLNWHFQSGGNNFLWGLYRNGQVPGPWGDGLIPGPCAGPAPAYPYAAPAPVAEAFPFYGNMNNPAVPAAPAVNPAPARNPGTQAWQFGTIPNWYPGQEVYQAVNYQPGYAAPNYGTPSSNYGYPGYGGGYDYYSGYNQGNVPSYWYGR